MQSVTEVTLIRCRGTSTLSYHGANGLLLEIDHADAVVVVVGDVEIACAIERNAIGRVESSTIGTSTIARISRHTDTSHDTRRRLSGR